MYRPNYNEKVQKYWNEQQRLQRFFRIKREKYNAKCTKTEDKIIQFANNPNKLKLLLSQDKVNTYNNTCQTYLMKRKHIEAIESLKKLMYTDNDVKKSSEGMILLSQNDMTLSEKPKKLQCLSVPDEYSSENTKKMRTKIYKFKNIIFHSLFNKKIRK